MGRELLAVCLLLGLVAGCGNEEPTPSLVGHAWQVRIGGTEEAPPDSTMLAFDGVERVYFIDGPQQIAFSANFREPIPLTMIGEPSGGLPARLEGLDAARIEGVTFSGITYCGFVNSAGLARNEELQAVEKGVAALVSALEAPLREADFSEESLRTAGLRAVEALIQKLREELDRTGQPESTSKLLANLEARVDKVFNVDIESLTRTLPSLVWAFGDSATRGSLQGCGSLLLFDLSESARKQEFSLLYFPGLTCAGTNVGKQALACSLEAWSRTPLDERFVRLISPPESSFFAIWDVYPNLTLTPP